MIDLDTIRNRLPVATVAQDLGLEGRGSRFYCPSCQPAGGKTPDLSTSRGDHWHCFKCGAKGDVFDLVMLKRGGTFRDAAEYLAPVAGVVPRRSSGSPLAGTGTGRAPRAQRSVARGAQTCEPVWPVEPVRNDLEDLVARFEAALPGSPGEEYLRRRGVSLALARRYRLGFADGGKLPAFATRKRDLAPRVIVPHTRPDGEIVNLYGRSTTPAPGPCLPHRHLSGNRGAFNAPALSTAGPVIVTEGAFDALAVMAALPGFEAVAVFGVTKQAGGVWNGKRLAWFRSPWFTLALDNDDAGRAASLELARALDLRGARVDIVDVSVYGGCKDLSEAWAVGALLVHELLDYETLERAAILEEAGLDRDEATRVALAGR